MGSDTPTPDPLARLTALVATMTPGEWYVRGPLTDEEAGRPGGEPATLVAAVRESDSEESYTDIIDDVDLRGLAALRNLAAPLLAVVRAADEVHNEADHDPCGLVLGFARCGVCEYRRARAALNAAIAQEVGGDG